MLEECASLCESSDDEGEEKAAGQDKAQKEYKDLIKKHYLGNQLSGGNIKELVQKAQSAGAKGAEDLSNKAMPQNANRSMLRGLDVYN